MSLVGEESQVVQVYACLYSLVLEKTYSSQHLALEKHRFLLPTGGGLIAWTNFISMESTVHYRMATTLLPQRSSPIILWHSPL